LFHNLCYTHNRMQTDSLNGTRSSWPQWADFLRQRGLESFAAWALDALTPIFVLGAQMLHFGSPLVRPTFSAAQIESLADLLEDPTEARAFAAFLREEVTS
jgi:hypothetical protein